MTRCGHVIPPHSRRRETATLRALVVPFRLLLPARCRTPQPLAFVSAPERVFPEPSGRNRLALTKSKIGDYLILITYGAEWEVRFLPADKPSGDFIVLGLAARVFSIKSLRNTARSTSS